MIKLREEWCYDKREGEKNGFKLNDSVEREEEQKNERRNEMKMVSGLKMSKELNVEWM